MPMKCREACRCDPASVPVTGRLPCVCALFSCQISPDPDQSRSAQISWVISLRASGPGPAPRWTWRQALACVQPLGAAGFASRGAEKARTGRCRLGLTAPDQGRTSCEAELWRSPDRWWRLANSREAFGGWRTTSGGLCDHCAHVSGQSRDSISRPRCISKRECMFWNIL
jgi:hypothetical protein